ncbi:ABC transporter permease [Metasolibacillus sp.]|uniref:ABC transporter permease n=1 Tax=Metasolibacillus sp. TaxID=2703680 RepID=UPI0025EBEF57|nr:ABC transporter permease [Metasolibacillus sp.]MCT6924655.1 ABC transporter permease [Metasolibacillus sp.]MCT6940857.1 ABC transporter permease [Metasolibacillus sp.]
MNNMDNIWKSRFVHYINEVQKYMRFIVTGHIAIVFVFVIGAAGYQYSEWLKVAPASFPAEWLVAAAVGLVLAFSRPTTLIREPDQVYLLPLETQMPAYFKKAVNWTFWSQLIVPVIVYIVAIPLLNTVTELSSLQVWLGLAFVIALKYLNVKIEFNYRFANRGHAIVIDRLARGALSILAIETALTASIYMAAIYLVLFIAYNMSLKKRVADQPVPYEHFVRLEQNRMLRFYRFANYFTDVPHLRGTIRHRAWLDGVYKWIPFAQKNTQLYLVWRTFIRTDDHFYLWVRLTAIAAVITAFVDISIVAWIVAAALAFATTLQLKVALLSNGEFRMDMLFPIAPTQRKQAVEKLLRIASVVQAVIVTLCAMMQPHFYVIFVVMIAVSELTLRLSKK